MSRIAFAFAAGRSLERGVERVALAESLGYDSVWVTQIADREATVVASAIANGTEKIGIGTGVLPLYPRTPVVMAQTAATIDELSSGRFILGIGTSHKVTIEGWHGIKLERPLKHVREYVECVKAILRGEAYSGEIYATGFSFMGYQPVRGDLPVYISCLSPKMCRLAGEVADGAVLWMCAPGYIEKVIVPEIAKGRRKAGKDMEGFEVVAAVPVSLTENVKEGRDRWRQVAITYWNLPFYRAAIEGAGFSEALKRFDEEGPAAIPDEVVDEFAGIGDEDACGAAIERYRSAGATLPNMGPLPSHEGAANLETTLKALAP